MINESMRRLFAPPQRYVDAKAKREREQELRAQGYSRNEAKAMVKAMHASGNEPTQ